MGVIGIGSFDLKWEKNKVFNFGLDLIFWDCLSFILDYYMCKINDLLMNKWILYVLGYYDLISFVFIILQNVGLLENKGVEISLLLINMQIQDLIWIIIFNIGYNKNKLVKLDGIQIDEIDGVLIY